MTLWIFSERYVVNNKSVLKYNGPLLLASNHPNSFFDAIIMGVVFRKPIHFLARGDSMKGGFANWFLTKMNVIPIYRQSEGRDNMGLNQQTFERCQEVLQNKGILLIFAEGLCKNKWELRSVKKGPSRIALEAWGSEDETRKNLQVLPIGLNYNTYKGFRKRIYVACEELIDRSQVDFSQTLSLQMKQFNDVLTQRLQKVVFVDTNDHHLVPFVINNMNHFISKTDQINFSEIEKKYGHIDFKTLGEFPYRYFTKEKRFFKGVLLVVLSVPALLGWLLNLPYYKPLESFFTKKTEGTVFYDSVLFLSMMFTYPLYYGLFNLLVWIFLSQPALLISLLLPVWGRVYVSWKGVLLGLKNKKIAEVI